MPRPARLSKTALAAKLCPVFERYGYDGASLAMLAEACGLSKASLYHHFSRGKEDMALYALAHAGARLQKLVLAPLADKNLGPVERLSASLDGTARYYGGEVPHCLMNSLLLGEGRALFSGQIKAAVTAWRLAFQRVLTDGGVAKDTAEAWARVALERLQGSLVLCRVEGTRDPLETCLRGLAAGHPLS